MAFFVPSLRLRRHGGATPKKGPDRHKLTTILPHRTPAISAKAILSAFPTFQQNRYTMHATPTRQHLLVRLDTRVKIIVCGVLGILTWQVSPVGLALFGLFTGLLVQQGKLLTASQRPIIRNYLTFVLFWAMLVFLLEILPENFVQQPLEIFNQFTPATLLPAASKASVLAARLTVLILVGLTLAFTASPRQLGLALAWFLHPVMGKKSWKTALSLALMIHFLPLVQTTFTQARQAMLLRQPTRNTMQRFLLVLQAVLRILGQKTWTQTVAVAARGLDHPQAWQTTLPANLTHWALGTTLCAMFFTVRILFPV